MGSNDNFKILILVYLTNLVFKIYFIYDYEIKINFRKRIQKNVFERFSID